MKTTFFFFLKYFIYWIAVGVLCRLLFCFYHIGQSLDIGWNQLLSSFLYGLRMDASLAGYLCFFPFILYGLLSPKHFGIFLKAYTYIILFTFVGLAIIDLELYASWKYRIEFSSLEYLKHYKEAVASVESSPIITLFALWFIFFMIGKFIFKKFLSLPEGGIRSFKKGLICLVSSALLILPIRGGVGIAPLNPGAVYHSHLPFANHCAINVLWNFLYSAVHRHDINNPYHFFSSSELDNVWKSLMPENNKPFIDLKSKQPNVLFIVWESFTAKVVGQKHKGVEITPFFNQLKNTGIYFSRAFASGDRTEKGLAAVISGYPAQPTASIVKESAKAAKLPSIASVLKKYSYNTGLYYGGDLEFANMKAYLWSAGFDQLISKNDFDASLSTTKWGVHDHHVFNHFIKQTHAQPFFKVLLTLSSHEPFDVPSDIAIKGEDNESRFLNALHYTDACLGNFINEASHQAWWKNTIVVIVADHGHSLPEKEDRYEDFHIPILWTGGAVDTSLVIKNTVSQIDIVSHILSTINVDSSPFIFSKNLDVNNAWAYFAFNNGLGFINDSCHIMMDNQSQKIIESDQCSTSSLNKGKAFLQKSFDHYLHCQDQ